MKAYTGLRYSQRIILAAPKLKLQATIAMLSQNDKKIGCFGPQVLGEGNHHILDAHFQIWLTAELAVTFG